MIQQNNEFSDDQSINFEVILDLVKAGESISTHMRDVVRQNLTSPNSETDIYTLIHIVGKLNDREFSSLIEKYLNYGLGPEEAYDDPEMVRRIATQVLCSWWHLPNFFEHAIHAAFHDPSEYVRMAAASAIGNLGLHYSALRKQAAQQLLTGLEQFREDNEVWASFYSGLLCLLDVPFSLHPDPTRDLHQEDIDPNLIDKARRIAGET